MTQIIELQREVALYSSDRYPRRNDEAQGMGLSGGRNAEMRAMTIAAFRIAQNNTHLSQREMDAELLEFLVANSTSAIGYWQREGRLQRNRATYQLTPNGIAECQNTLLGLAGGYSTTEQKVQEWLDRMQSGDSVAIRRRAFGQSSWATA